MSGLFSSALRMEVRLLVCRGQHPPFHEVLAWPVHRKHLAETGVETVRELLA